MQLVNVNQMVHCASPYFLGVCLHTWTVVDETIKTGFYPLGAVIGKPKQGLITAEARVSEQYASNERLSVVVKAVSENGTVRTLLNKAIDSNSGVGLVSLLDNNRPLPVAQGDVLFVRAVYLAASGPVAPLVALVFQVG